jgi:hypothetical protein
MSLSHSPRIVTDGLVLCLDASDPQSYSGSGTTWYDRSGNNYDFTAVNGPTYSNGKFSFDGSNDYFNSPYSTTITDNFHWTPDGSIGSSTMSYEVWYRTSDSNGLVFSHPWNGNGQYNILIYANGSVNVHSNNGGYSNYVGGVNDGNWHCVSLCLNSTTLSVYTDGELHDSQSHGRTGGAGTLGNSSNLRLALMTLYPYGGSWTGNTGFSVDGDLAITRIYQKTLTASEVLQNYNAQKSKFGL